MNITTGLNTDDTFYEKWLWIDSTHCNSADPIIERIRYTEYENPLDAKKHLIESIERFKKEINND